MHAEYAFVIREDAKLMYYASEVNWRNTQGRLA